MTSKRGHINWGLLAIVAVIIGGYFIFKKFGGSSSEQLAIMTDSLVFKRGCQNADAPCLELILKFPVMGKGSNKNLNKNVLEHYLNMIGIEEECSNLDSFKSILMNHAYSVDSSYVQYMNDMGEDAIGMWFQKIDMQIVRSDSKMNVIKYSYSDYMGGAHGSYRVHYLNIDTKKHNILTIGDVVTDVKELTRIAEQYFIENAKKNDITYPDDFWFENNQFALPQEIGFTDSAIILQYNVYEVACYAAGDFEIIIPYSAIQHLLKK